MFWKHYPLKKEKEKDSQKSMKLFTYSLWCSCCQIQYNWLLPDSTKVSLQSLHYTVLRQQKILQSVAPNKHIMLCCTDSIASHQSEFYFTVPIGMLLGVAEVHGVHQKLNGNGLQMYLVLRMLRSYTQYIYIYIYIHTYSAAWKFVKFVKVCLLLVSGLTPFCCSNWR